MKTTMIYAPVSDDHLENLVNLLPATNLVTHLVTKKDLTEEEEAKLLKRKEWAMQDLNLRLLPCDLFWSQFAPRFRSMLWKLNKL